MEMPLPRHQEHRARHQTHHSGQTKANPRADHQTRRAFQRQGNTQGLKQRQHQRAVTGVLRDFAPAGLTLFLERLQRWHHVGHQLHDDRGRDVRHDPQCKHRETRQSTTREHVEQVQDAALLPFKQSLKLLRIDARYGDMRPDAVHHQRQSQEGQPAIEVAKLA